MYEYSLKCDNLLHFYYEMCEFSLRNSMVLSLTIISPPKGASRYFDSKGSISGEKQLQYR